MGQKYPLNNHRRLMICGDPGGGEPIWLPLAAGIKSRKDQTAETVGKFYELSQEAQPAEEPLEQEVRLLLWGRRCVGDPAQELAFAGGDFGQEVGFLDWDTWITNGLNGRKGRGILTAQYLGGDSDGRQEVCFTLRVCGGTEKGTVTEQDGRITFRPEEG